MPIKAGVIGDPIAHSLSRVLHGYWLKAHHIEGTYDKFHIPALTLLQDVKKLAFQKDFSGFNVTIPHKRTIMPFCATLHEVARHCKAVNLVIFDEERNAHGFNTDVYGFIQNVYQNAPFLTNKEANRTAVVFGAGGVARAVCVALKQMGYTLIKIFNRTLKNAQILANDMGAMFVPYAWDARHDHLKEAHLMVNATSLGMNGVGTLGLNWSHASPQTIVVDTVYTPLKTPFLSKAENHGLQVIDGLGMLLHQAVPSFQRLFKTHTPPQVTADLRHFLLQKQEGLL